MTRVNILTAKNDGHESFFAPESIELRLDLKQVLVYIRDDLFIVEVRCDVPSRDDPSKTLMVRREAWKALDALAEGEEAAWRETGALPACTRELLHYGCLLVLGHEFDEMYLDANGVRVRDPHKDDE